MLADNLAVSHTKGPCRRHVLALLEHQNLASDHPCHSHPVQKGKDDKHGDEAGSHLLHPLKARDGGQLVDAGPQRHGQQDNQQDIRYGVQDVGKPHHDVIHPAAGKAGHRAKGSADEQHQDGAHDAHRQADPGGHHQPDGKVPAQLIGAADVGEHLFPRLNPLQLGFAVLKEGQVFAVLDLLVVGIGPKAGQDVGKDDDQQDKEEADHGDPVLPQPAQAVGPEVDAFPHNDEAFLFVGGGGGKVVGGVCELCFFVHGAFPPFC